MIYIDNCSRIIRKTYPYILILLLYILYVFFILFIYTQESYIQVYSTIVWMYIYGSITVYTFILTCVCIKHVEFSTLPLVEIDAQSRSNCRRIFIILFIIIHSSVLFLYFIYLHKVIETLKHMGKYIYLIEFEFFINLI